MNHPPTPDPNLAFDVDQALAACRAARTALDHHPTTAEHRDTYHRARRQLHRARRAAIDHHTATQPHPGPNSTSHHPATPKE